MRFRQTLIDLLSTVLFCTTITSLIGTGAFTSGAIASLGMEIIQKNSNLNFTEGRDWESQRNIFIGAALLSFSGFCGSRVINSVVEMFDE
jgi:hypothetical protein